METKNNESRFAGTVKDEKKSTFERKLKVLRKRNERLSPYAENIEKKNSRLKA